MVYRVIGIMSGSSLDGLDLAFVEIQENAGKWNYEIINAACIPYDANWSERLRSATSLNALEYQLLHADFGHFIGRQVNQFIEDYGLQFKIALIASHGHTTFHLPERHMTAQLGDGAAIAATTQLPVVSDLRALDVAFGGQGAPIVPIGEKLLLSGHDLFLNIGGIANISSTAGWGFDICPANRVLNLLANDNGAEFDDQGRGAASGKTDTQLLEQLNGLGYYTQAGPKSLANDFGTGVVYPMIKQAGLSVNDALRTYVEHIVLQTGEAIMKSVPDVLTTPRSMLVTGGGEFNTFLMEQLADHLLRLNVTLVIPDDKLIRYKEAMIMALIGVLRWRQEYNVLSSVTGAERDSIGGALWNGQLA